MDGTRPDALSDVQLDRELEAALGVEPSPEFLARVRTRVATEPQPSTWRPAWWRSAVEPMWAVAIAGIVLAVVVPEFVRDERVPPRAVAVNVGQPRQGERTVPASIEARATPRRSTSRESVSVSPAGVDSVHTVPLRLSPVLFSEDDRRVFALFVAAVGEGRIPEEAVERAEISVEMEDLSIKPLMIAPLPLLARTGPEGEDQWE